MKVTENLRHALTCLVRQDQSFYLTLAHADNGARTILWTHDVGSELPEEFAAHLRQEMERLTHDLKDGQGQVYFFWDLNKQDVHLFSPGFKDLILSNGKVLQLNGASHPEPDELLAFLETFTLESLFH